MKIKIFFIASALSILPAYGQKTKIDEAIEPTELKDVIVTTRGIAERQFDVPFTIHVLNGKERRQQQLHTLENVATTMPGIQMQNSGDVSYSVMRIRGTGSLTPTSLDDNAVGIHIDGVAQGLVGVSESLYDVAQIEVAKGPQGTLFGRNSSAGAINIKTHNPEYIVDRQIRFGLGSEKSRFVEGMINLPLSNTLALRIAGINRVEDHHIYDKNSQKPINQKKSRALRGKLLWQVNDKTQWLFSGHYHQRKGYFPLSMIGINHVDKPLYDLGKLEHSGTRNSRGFSSEIRYRANAFTWESLSAFNQQEGGFTLAEKPLDFLPALYRQMRLPETWWPMINTYYQNPVNNQFTENNRTRQWTQELRFKALPEAKVQWVAGLYLSKSKRVFDYNAIRGLLTISPAMPPLGADALNAQIRRTSNTDIQAIFGELTIPVGKRWKTIAGLRLTHEKLAYHSHWQANQISPLATLGQRNYSETLNDTYLTGRLGLDYFINPHWHVYGLYSRGHTSAGFTDYGNTNIVGNHRETPYRAGHVDTLELGIKGKSRHRHWGVGLAVFQNNAANDKIAVYSKINPFLKDMHNVDTRSRGVEADAYWHINPHWKVMIATSYLDSEVTAAPIQVSDTVKVGNRMPQVPRWDSKIGAEYRHKLKIGNLKNSHFFANTDLHYVGKRVAEADNRLKLNSHYLWNIAVGIQTNNGSITLWGKNLSNQSYFYYAGLLGDIRYGLPAQGRTVGVDIRYQF